MEYNMPYIEGVNWETAFHYMPGKEMLLKVLEEIVKYADTQVKTLIELKNAIITEPSPKNFKEYGVHAHSMKSTLRSLGSDLFDEAYELELAGTECRENVIIEKTDPFVQKYIDLIEKLKPVVYTDDAQNVFDENDFFERISIIRKAMNSFDISTLQSNMRDVSDMKVPQKYKKVIGSLEEAVRNLDTEGVMKSCEELEVIRVQ